MADIKYWGLTGTKRSVTGITLATATVDTLITAIATDDLPLAVGPTITTGLRAWSVMFGA